MKQFYRNEHFFEQLLLLCNDDNEVLDRYPIHHVIWANESKYFDSLFHRWQKDEVIYHIKDNETVAFDSVIKYFYQKTLEVFNIQLLYKTVLIADRLGCDLLNVAIERLQTFNIETIDIKSLSAFYDAPSGILINKEFMDLINKCLFSKLGDFNKVMETATLLKEFMSLSYEGMKYLLCRNDITTESEDIVFILVKLWMTEGEGSMIPLECRREIGNLIRLINNCEILLTQIVPKQDWIDISDDEIIYLKQLKNYKNLKQGMIGDNFQFQKEEIFKSNVSWFLKNRLLSHCCPKTCFLFNLDMQSILQ